MLSNINWSKQLFLVPVIIGILLCCFLATSAPQTMAQSTVRFRPTIDCMGRLDDGRLVVQRYDKWYLVNEQSPSEEAESFSDGFSTEFDHTNVQSIEQDVSGEHFCLTEIDFNNTLSSLTFGSFTDIRRIGGTSNDVILDAQLDPQGRFVMVLRQKLIDTSWIMGLERVNMNGEDTVLWTVSTVGPIESASIRDSLLVFSTGFETKTMNLEGEFGYSVRDYQSILHITSNGTILGIQGPEFVRYDQKLNEIGRTAIPQFLEQYRIGGDQIALLTHNTYSLLFADGTVFTDSIPSGLQIKSVTPDGRNGLYITTTTGDFISVHPDRPRELRYQLLTMPGQPIFTSGNYGGEYTTFMGSLQSAVVARYSEAVNGWVIPERFLKQLFSKNIAIDCDGNYLSLLRNAANKSSEIIRYNLATDQMVKYAVPGQYTGLHFLQNGNVLLLSRVNVDGYNYLTMRQSGELLDSIGASAWFMRPLGDTAVMTSDGDMSYVVNVSTDGILSGCTTLDMFGNGLSRTAEKRNRYLGTSSSVVSSFGLQCSDLQTEPVPFQGITSVLSVADSMMYVQNNSRILSSTGDQLLIVEGLLASVFTDSDRVYTQSYVGPIQVVQVVRHDTPTSVFENPQRSLHGSFLFLWDGYISKFRSESCDKHSEFAVYTVMGEYMGNFDFSDTGHIFQMPTGIYVGVPIL